MVGSSAPSQWTRPGAWGLGLALLASGCVAPVEELSTPEIALEAPDELDLGWVARDEAVEGSFSIENVGPSAVLLDGLQPLEGSGPIDRVRLELELGPSVLRPGETIDAIVRVVAGPEATGELVVPLRVLAPDFPPDDPRLPVVALRARVSPSGLVAEPNPLTIGPVTYLDTGTATVAIRNLRAATVEVFALRHSEGRAQYDEAVTRGAFGPLPEVDREGRLAVLGPREAFVVSIAYTAPEGEGEAKEQAVWRVGSCPDPEACALTLVVQGLPDHEAPRVRLTPSGVHFGPTPVGASVDRELRISNEGQRPLVVSDFAFEGSDEIVAVLPSEATVAPDQAVVARFTYTPRDESLDNAQLNFRSNDPIRRTSEVRITGAGVLLPPCRVELSPPVLDFGIVEVFGSLELYARVRSVGEEQCVVFDPRIEHTDGTAEGSFVLRGEVPGSITLDPGEEVRMGVVFAPGRPGRHTGVLRLRTSGDEVIEIPLLGRTPGDVGISCTPDRSVEVGSPLRLVAALSSQATAQSYRWRLLDGPMLDGVITADFVPGPDAGPEVQIVPFVLGSYGVQADVETTDGDRFSCQTRVTAVSSGLKVRLTWDGAGDLDLHLHRGTPSPWFGADDCHFENLRPIWVRGQGAATGPNPSLDRDDTSGDGPENIRIETPQIGRPYTIAVSHFERAAGRRARVEVFCGRAMTRLDLTSRPFRGAETGACTRNDFWTLATIRFTAPDQCEVETIDTYRTTRDACATF